MVMDKIGGEIFPQAWKSNITFHSHMLYGIEHGIHRIIINMVTGNNEYMTVKEFAAAAGVTRQTIYSQIDRGVLSEFVTEIDGAKMIDRKALSKFTVKRQSSDSQNDSKIDSQNELIKALQERISAQEKTIEHQQQTIESLTAALTGAQQLQYLERQERMKLLEVAEAEPSSTDEAEPSAAEAGSECGHSERGKVHFFEYIWQSITGKAKQDNHKDETKVIQ